MENKNNFESEIIHCMLEQDYFEDIFERGFKIGEWNIPNDYNDMKKRAKLFIEKELKE